MNRSLLVASTLILMAGFQLSAQESKADPREELKTAIPHAIKLLEQKEYKTFMEQFVPPKIIETMKGSGMFEQIAQRFGQGEKSKQLLSVLKEVKDIQPEYNADKTEATYKLKEARGNKEKIVFKTEGKLWYINN